MSRKFRFASALPVSECASRLVSAMDHESLVLSRLHPASGAKLFAGEVRQSEFILRVRITGRNSFQTYASGNLHALEGGTMIEGQFSAHPGFKLGRWSWGCLTIFVGLPTLLGLLSMMAAGEVNWRNLSTGPILDKLIILVAVVAPALLYAVGRLSAAGEAETLRSFLLATLQAREA